MASDDTAPGDEMAEEYTFHLYQYLPSLAAAAVAVVVFAVLTALHAWRMQKAKAYYFVPFLIGGICKSISRGITSRYNITDSSLLKSPSRRLRRKDLVSL